MYIFVDNAIFVSAGLSTSPPTLVKEAVQIVCEDPGFLLPSPVAADSLSCAKSLAQWIEENFTCEIYMSFCRTTVKSITQCLPTKLSKKGRAKLWEQLFQLQISEEFLKKWEDFFRSIGVKKDTLFYQRVSDVIAELLIQQKYDSSMPRDKDLEPDTDDLTYEECNIIRYASGFILRSLKKKLSTSAHPLKDEILEHLTELVVDPNEDIAGDASTDWINMIDRGGLVHVNEMMYLMMKHMETTMRQGLKCETADTLKEDCIKAITTSDDVLFYWDLITGMWNDEEREALLNMIVELWVTIRGFAYASGWMEQYKQAAKKSIQKSKGIRKKLIE